MKKKVVFISVLIILFGCIVSPKLVGADSGHDISHGSSSSSSFSDSSSGSSGKPISVRRVITMFTIVIGAIIVVNIIKGDSSKNNEVSDEELRKYGINDKKLLEQELYNKYVEIQQAWMNFDYNRLRTLTSDSLFNTYSEELNTLRLKEEKNIIDSFKYISSKILELKEENNILTLKLRLIIDIKDYIVDKNNKVIKGDDRRIIRAFYEIEFEKSLTNLTNKCPNCGAEITNHESNECPYCKSIIVQNSADFVMSNKRIIGQY